MMRSVAKGRQGAASWFGPKGRQAFLLVSLSLLVSCAQSPVARPLHSSVARNLSSEKLEAGAIPPVWFADRLREFEAEDQRELFAPGGIVFIGSSSIHFWEGLRGDFPAYRVLNRGIAGAQTSDLLMVLPRLVHRYSPRQVVIYVGTNDLSAGKSNDQVLRDLSTLFDQIRVSFPQTRISWIELAPNPARWWLLETFRDLNSKVAAGVSERSSFEIIPVFHAMLGEDGRPLQGIFREDQLHLNARGYALWKALIGPYLLPEPNAIPVLEGATSNP